MAISVDVYVLLDLLLIILVALFVPIGFWRGAYRESFVTLGILFGASLGNFWGERWGTELSEVTRLHEAGGAFMIAMLCLISATFLLGYSAGAAIPVPDPGWVSRTLGALIAGANGALLLSFALHDIRIYLLTSEEVGFLDNAVIAPFLSDGTGWILLVAAAVFVPIALVLALFGPDIEEEEFYEDSEYDVFDVAEYDPYPQRTMQHSQRKQGYVQSRPQVTPAPTPRPAPIPAEETRPVPTTHHQPPPHEDPASTQRRNPQEPVPGQQPQGPVFGQQPRAPLPTDAPDESKATQPVEQAPVPPRNVRSDTQPYRPGVEPAEQSSPDTQPESQAALEIQPPQPVQAQPHFGTRTVQEQQSEQPVSFGHRPQTEEFPAQPPRQSTSNCPNCQADIRDATGFCPRCGEPI